MMSAALSSANSQPPLHLPDIHGALSPAGRRKAHVTCSLRKAEPWPLMKSISPHTAGRFGCSMFIPFS